MGVMSNAAATRPLTRTSLRLVANLRRAASALSFHALVIRDPVALAALEAERARLLAKAAEIEAGRKAVQS